MYSRLVVPLDHSHSSEAALPLAAHLAERRNIPITLVHVIEVPPDLASFMHRSSGVDELLEIERGSHQYLEGLAAGISGMQVETAVLRGQVVSALVEYVDGLAQPLIVMSGHGHTGFRRMLVGSTTARVVHAAHCPVLVVHVEDEGAEPKGSPDVTRRIRRVLVPLDGSDFAEHALHATYELLTRKDAAIRLIRVPEVASYPATMYGPESYQAAEIYMEAMESESETYLTAVAERLKQEHEGDVSWEVRQGTPGHAILEAAREFDADLIALATHGRTGFRRILLGSVAEHVLNHAQVPVLMVGPHDAENDATG